MNLVITTTKDNIQRVYRPNEFRKAVISTFVVRLTHQPLLWILSSQSPRLQSPRLEFISFPCQLSRVCELRSISVALPLHCVLLA